MWRRWPPATGPKVGAHIGFDETLAHSMEGGADIFLMPSRFEPCGLNQMYSMRYGTVPVVHAVGGLADTVGLHAGRDRTGFSFHDYRRRRWPGPSRRALTAYANKRAWRALQVAGMRQDFSWDRSAKSTSKYMIGRSGTAGWGLAG